MLSVALRATGSFWHAGAKTICTTQLLTEDVGQLSLSRNSGAFAPETEILEIVSCPAPELVNVIDCAALFVPACWLPKLIGVGAIVIAA